MRKQQKTGNALNWHNVQDKRTITVLEQVEKYVATKNNVRYSTRTGYMTVINLLKSDEFGKERIDVIRISDAKLWLIKLQTQDGKGYSSIHAIRGVLKPAFQLAVDDDYIAKNPFAFDLSSIIINDREKRECLSYKDEKRFLDFIRTDPHYCKYYEGVYILFKTGLRISEFCGLTCSIRKSSDRKTAVIEIEGCCISFTSGDQLKATGIVNGICSVCCLEYLRIP